MVMMLIAFFFLLMDGPRLVDWVVEVLPLRKKQTVTLLTDFRKVTVAVLVSSIATSAIQAAVAFVGYLLARVPNADLLRVRHLPRRPASPRWARERSRWGRR